MQHTIYFISHPEVCISSTVPVTQWPLSDIGRKRMQAMLDHSWVSSISAIYCSEEQKAIEGADILGRHLLLKYTTVHELGENDRSSTGFLEPAEFESTADSFFASPNTPIRRWETASAAQKRIVDCMNKIDQEDNTGGAIAIVSHGAVGTLLYCALTRKKIERRWDQPRNGGGNYLQINTKAGVPCAWWESID